MGRTRDRTIRRRPNLSSKIRGVSEEPGPFVLGDFLRTMREVAALTGAGPRGPMTPGETVEHVLRVVRDWSPPVEVEAAAGQVVAFLRALEASRGARGPAARVGLPASTLRAFSTWAAEQVRARRGP